MNYCCLFKSRQINIIPLMKLLQQVTLLLLIFYFISIKENDMTYLCIRWLDNLLSLLGFRNDLSDILGQKPSSPETKLFALDNCDLRTGIL